MPVSQKIYCQKKVKNGFSIRMVSFRSGLVEILATFVSINFSKLFIYI